MSPAPFDAYIVIEGRRIRLHSLSVSRQFDTLDVTCLSDRVQRYAVGPGRMTIEAVALEMEDHHEPVKCGACGSSDYRWHESTGRVCSYCRTPAA